MNPMLEAALHYQSIGLSVIPIKPRDKKPIIPWQEFQKRIADQEEIKGWWADLTPIVLEPST